MDSALSGSNHRLSWRDGTVTSSSDRLRIGFIGLGTMGLHMARRLAARGHDLMVFDLAPEPVRALLSDHPNVVASADMGGLAARSDFIATCLPSSDAVRAVYLDGPSALACTARAKTITIDHSTTAPDISRQIHSALAERDVRHLDAPLFGGGAHARDGQLYLALSGSDSLRPDGRVLPPLRDIIDAIARGSVWVGGPGVAMAMKVLQNGLGLVQLAAIAEVAAACERLNVDPRLFHEVVMDAGGMAASPLFRREFARMIDEHEQFEARLAIAAKDAQLHYELVAPGAEEQSPCAASTRAFSAALARGLADRDVTSVREVFAATEADIR